MKKQERLKKTQWKSKTKKLPRLKILCINNQQKSTIISTLTTTVRTWLGQTHSVLFHPYGDSEQCIYGSEEPAAQRDENQGGRNLHCRGGVGGFWRLLCRKAASLKKDWRHNRQEPRHAEASWELPGELFNYFTTCEKKHSTRLPGFLNTK